MRVSSALWGARQKQKASQPSSALPSQHHLFNTPPERFSIELTPQVAQRAEDLESADDFADSHP